MCGALGACTSSGEPPLRLGTTYTVEQSGALALLDSLARPTLTTVVGPSGQILAAAARGDLDVVITHAPSLEQRLLLAPGHVLLACPFVASRFAIVGPAADPAHVGAAPSAADAFRRIAAAAGPFVSRGDSSGTHVKELALWQAAHLRPAGAWYIQSGADQVTTLHVADESDASALADLPTLAKLTGLRLHVLFATDTALTNPYTLYVVNKPGPGPRATAEAFARWAMSVARPRILELRLPDGTPGFVTRGGECAARDTTARSAGASAEPRSERALAPPVAPAPAAVLLGRWDYFPASRAPATQAPALGGGLQVTLEFDSVSGGTAYGRVRRWFAGDVGISPRAFGQVVGRVIGGEVELTLSRPQLIIVRAALVGRDTLAITTSRIGSDPGPFAQDPGAKFVRTNATE